LTTQYFLLTYYLFTYLLKSNPGNPVSATGCPVTNHYWMGTAQWWLRTPILIQGKTLKLQAIR